MKSTSLLVGIYSDTLTRVSLNMSYPYKNSQSRAPSRRAAHRRSNPWLPRVELHRGPDAESEAPVKAVCSSEEVTALISQFAISRRYPTNEDLLAGRMEELVWPDVNAEDDRKMEGDGAGALEKGPAPFRPIATRSGVSPQNCQAYPGHNPRRHSRASGNPESYARDPQSPMPATMASSVMMAAEARHQAQRASMM